LSPDALTVVCTSSAGSLFSSVLFWKCGDFTAVMWGGVARHGLGYTAVCIDKVNLNSEHELSYTDIPTYWSWGGSVSLTTNCTTGTPGFYPRQRQRSFPLASVSIPALRPTHFLIQWVPGGGGPFPGDKARPERDADHKCSCQE
jgi:hypothetical protein